MLNVKKGMSISNSSAPKIMRQIKAANNHKFTLTNSATTVAQPKTRPFTWTWKYDAVKFGSRDLRLDFLRGWCIFVMLIDHMGIFGTASWLYAITFNGDFYVSAAEGFVFISGVVMGLVYFKLIAKEGIGNAVPKIYSRVWKLYLLAVSLTVITTLLAMYTPLKLWADREWLMYTDPFEMIIGALTLHWGFHGSSILIMYVLFLALAPAIFYALSKGKTWTVLGVSTAIWVGNIFYPNQFSQPFAANFPLASWQFLFVTGLLIGWHREKLLNLVSGMWRNVYVVGVSALAVFMLCAYIAHKSGSLAQVMPFLENDALWTMFNDKALLPLPRMLMIFVYFQALYLLVTWLWKPIQKLIGWYLVPVGEVSLYSYTLHLLVIVVVYNIPGFMQLPYVLYGFAQLGAAMLIYFAVKTKFLSKVIPS
jgi:hypothetical protein